MDARNARRIVWAAALAVGFGIAARGQVMPREPFFIWDMPSPIVGNEASQDQPDRFVYPDAIDLDRFLWEPDDEEL